MNFVLMLLLVIPGFFFLGIAAVGSLRLPDFYTRSHAIGVMDTLGTFLILSGLAFYEGVGLNSAKIWMLMFFFFIVNPTMTHVLMRGALRSGLKQRPVK